MQQQANVRPIVVLRGVLVGALPFLWMAVDILRTSAGL